MTVVLVLLVSLSADARRELTKAIESHIAGDFAAALDGYQSLLERHPEFAPARIYAAEALWLTGQHDEARRKLERVEKEQPDLLAVRWLRWHFFDAAGGDDAIPRRLESVYPFERNRFIATGTPSLILLSRGERELAVDDFRRASALDRGDVLLHRQLGAAFAKAGLPLEAAEAYECVVAQEPKEVAAWKQLGSSLLVLQRWQSAIDAFEQVLELGGDDVGTLLAQGYAYERLSDFEEALERYRQATRLAPSASQPHYRLGRAFLVQNDLGRAEKALLKACELEPSAVEPHAFLGELYLKRKDYEEAVAILESAVALDAEYFEAWYRLAHAYQRSGRAEDAKRAMAKYEELKREQRVVPSTGPPPP